MQIVIDISEERFRDIQRIAEVQRESNHFKTAEQIVANGKPLPNSMWIPVGERLPEENGQYLITVKYKHINDNYEDIYAEHGEWFNGRWDMFCFGHCGEVEGIIAWMPLPEPYKEEKEDTL